MLFTRSFVAKRCAKCAHTLYSVFFFFSLSLSLCLPCTGRFRRTTPSASSSSSSALLSSPWISSLYKYVSSNRKKRKIHRTNTHTHTQKQSLGAPPSLTREREREKKGHTANHDSSDDRDRPSIHPHCNRSARVRSPKCRAVEKRRRLS